MEEALLWHFESMQAKTTLELLPGLRELGTGSEMHGPHGAGV